MPKSSISFWLAATIVLHGTLLNMVSATETWTSQSVVLIPREANLQFELPGCGETQTSAMCQTFCEHNISPELDQEVRMTYSDRFKAVAFETWQTEWNSSVDTILADSEFLDVAQKVQRRAQFNAHKSDTKSKDLRNQCRTSLKSQYQKYRGRLAPPQLIVRIVNHAFRSSSMYRQVERAHQRMLFNRLVLWYAKDTVRRLEEAIARGCPFLHRDGPAEDPCTSLPPAPEDLDIKLDPVAKMKGV